ncbi:NUDIX domain-containing protein [Paenibacillaceae bacterium]|nr:NUDIX domain-containing protein [Paenibacillaceae bacterium]
MEAKWLEWAKQIQAIAQTGLTYTKDIYDRERYETLKQLGIDILTNYTAVGSEKIELTFASDTGYATPKTDIRAVIFKDSKILLVRENHDGRWALPGGWADIGLSPSEVAVKEVKEESGSGYDVEAVRLLAVLDKKYHDHPPEPYHVYKYFILCKIVGGEALSGIETTEVGFFERDRLPKLSIERNTAAQVQTMFTFLHQPNKEVLID